MNYYTRYVRSLRTTGASRKPRGLGVVSKMNVTFTCKPCTTFRRPHDNPLIGFMEGLQFIAGVFNMSQISRIAPNAQLNLFGSTSSYGPRITGQVDQVIEELRNDHDTRRAVLVLAENTEGLADRPCTTSLQYTIRDGVLHTIVTMRSSDAVLGLPYDLIQFSMMSEMISACVKVPAAGVIINIGDAHIYNSSIKCATGYTPWVFTLPDTGYTTYEGWRWWALEEIPQLSMQRVVSLWNFHQVENSWMS